MTMFWLFSFQNLKNQIMTTNLWVEQVWIASLEEHEQVWNLWSISSPGTTTSYAGSRRSTGACRCCTSRPTTSGARTLCCTTSEYARLCLLLFGLILQTTTTSTKMKKIWKYSSTSVCISSLYFSRCDTHLE